MTPEQELPPPFASSGVGTVLSRVIRHPLYFLIRRWNWKSALLSCILRGSIFFITNLSAGFALASTAMLVEASFIPITAGFYGAIVQAFRKAKPEWAATLTVMGLLPTINHLLELLIHTAAATPRLKLSILTSITFSAISAAFNIFVMRRGVLLVGKHQQPLSNDLRQLPRMLLSFLFYVPVKTARWWLERIKKPAVSSTQPFT
ncbi:MAG: hypothetical protein AB1757_24255 [Acidobacteriota bacterium]